MYKGSYVTQNNNSVSLLNISDKDSVKRWAVSGTLKKAYDRNVKGYVYVSDINTKMQIPQDSRRQELYLQHPYLCLQIKVLNKKNFHIELQIGTNNDKGKKRLVFFSAQPYVYSRDNILRQPNQSRIPSSQILEGVWLNLQIDLKSFVEKAFESQHVFKSIDSVQIAGPCLVRRIFTTKTQIPDSFPFVLEREFGSEAAQGYEQFVAQQAMNQLNNPLTMPVEALDPKLNFQSGVDYMNQVMSYERLLYFGHLQESAGVVNGEVLDNKNLKFYNKPDIMFGERAVKHNSPQRDMKQIMGNSPSKIRQQGRLEMEQLRREENQYMTPLKGPASASTIQKYSKSELPAKLQGLRGLQSQASLDALDNYDPNSMSLPHEKPGRPQVNNYNILDDDHSPDFQNHPQTKPNRLSNFKIRSGLQKSPERGGQSPTKPGHQVHRSQPNLAGIQQQKGQQRPVVDDYMINDKLRRLQEQKTIISQLAQKHGLVDAPKIQTFSLLQVRGGGSSLRNNSVGGQNYDTFTPIKDKVNDYHEKVNARRKVIAEKAKKKRALEAEKLEAALPEQKSAPKPRFVAKKAVKKIASGNDEGSEEEVDVTDDEADKPHWRDAEGPAEVDPDGAEPGEEAGEQDENQDEPDGLDEREDPEEPEDKDDDAEAEEGDDQDEEADEGEGDGDEEY